MQAIAELSTSELARRCSEETARFFQRQENDPAYCYELFRRALEKRDERAWELIYSQYKKLVTSWVHKHSAFPHADERAGHFVNLAYQRLWSAIDRDKFSRFADLPSLLRYLQTCIHSVIMDHLRRRQLIHKFEEFGVEHGDMPSENPGYEGKAVEREIRREIWKCVEEVVKSEEERLVVYASFQLGLKPGEIYLRHKQTFPDVDAVYQIKANILGRLRRNKLLRELIDIDD